MRRVFTSILSLAAASACVSGSEPPPFTPAFITVAFTGIPADTIQVEVSDVATIVAAEKFVSTGSGPHLMIGTIVRGGLDPKYPFRFLPESVRLTDTAIEICDGAPMHTPAEVDDFIQGSTGSRQSPSATWCPWSSHPIKVTHLMTL